MYNPSTNNGEILIVDDDPTSLDLLCEMFLANQYNVRVATDGTLALASIQSSSPDLILLDINMPKMNGYELCYKIKANPNSQHIPIIFISANMEVIDKVRAFSLGGADYVTKPFQAEEVMARVKAHLKIDRLTKELQMQMLRYQLDPHFLFNALMSIRVLVVENELAEKIVTNLASYLRYLLLSRNKLELSVGEEIGAAQNYLAIEKLRFKDRLIITTDIDDKVRHYLMPAFVLQPLLENAIKYGMKTATLPLELLLSVKKNDGMLVICVTNSGKWVSPEDNQHGQHISLGIGLQNITHRLKQKYANRHTFNIKSEDDKVNVIIQIPIE